jgi:hypothetical protein
MEANASNQENVFTSTTRAVPAELQLSAASPLATANSNNNRAAAHAATKLDRLLASICQVELSLMMEARGQRSATSLPTTQSGILAGLNKKYKRNKYFV